MPLSKAPLRGGRVGRQRLVLASLAAALFLGASALALVTRVRPTPPPAASAARSGAAAEPGGPVQVVRFALYDTGLEPREAKAGHGRVVVSLTDYTGSASGLVVERETPDGVREQAGRVEREGGRWRGRQEMRLGPGTYAVYAEGRPETRATLTVEP